jgi:hypothetical protein
MFTPAVESASKRVAETPEGAHAGTHDRQLADLVVVYEALEADAGLLGGEGSQSRRGIRLGQSEGDVGAPGRRRGHVLDDHVDVGARLGDNREDLGRLPGTSGTPITVIFA